MDQRVTPRFKIPKSQRQKKVRSRDKKPGMSQEHLKKVRQLSSCVSGLRPCEAHHLRIKKERGVGQRARDRYTVPLTHEEHMELHRLGSRREVAWFKARGIDDPEALSDSLWFNNHDVETMECIVRTHRGST